MVKHQRFSLHNTQSEVKIDEEDLISLFILLINILTKFSTGSE